MRKLNKNLRRLIIGAVITTATLTHHFNSLEYKAKNMVIEGTDMTAELILDQAYGEGGDWENVEDIAVKYTSPDGKISYTFADYDQDGRVGISNAIVYNTFLPKRDASLEFTEIAQKCIFNEDTTLLAWD